jgi:hypothetical protein
MILFPLSWKGGGITALLETPFLNDDAGPGGPGRPGLEAPENQRVTTTISANARAPTFSPLGPFFCAASTINGGFALNGRKAPRGFLTWKSWITIRRWFMARLLMHPGEHLADEQKALGMSANELAKELGVGGGPRGGEARG